MYILASNMNAFYGRGYGSGYYMFDWTYLLVLIGPGTFPDCISKCERIHLTITQRSAAGAI